MITEKYLNVLVIHTLYEGERYQKGDNMKKREILKYLALPLAAFLLAMSLLIGLLLLFTGKPLPVAQLFGVSVLFTTSIAIKSCLSWW